ncbi:7552_t:CDS:2, partial [Dentiscutata heterogama]
MKIRFGRKKDRIKKGLLEFIIFDYQTERIKRLFAKNPIIDVFAKTNAQMVRVLVLVKDYPSVEICSGDKFAYHINVVL